MDISLGTVIRALSLTRLHPNRRTKSACRPQKKCGEISIRLSLPPTLTKTICTIIFALIRFPFLTERNTTIPKQSRENSVMYPTVYVENTVYPSSKIPIKRRQGRYGLMRKAANPQGTMFIVKMYGRQSISAAALTIWRNICGAKDISPTLRESIGRYGCRSTSILQGLIHWTKDGRLKIYKGQWGHTLLSETAGQQSILLPKCRRLYGIGFSLFKRRATSTNCISTTAIC